MSPSFIHQDTYRKVLVIIPAYNEQESIAQVVQEAKRSLPGAVVVVINDGSKDNTRQIAEQSGAFVLNHMKNLGIGATVQTGLKFAKKYEYEIAIQVDGDGQHRASDLPQMILPILRGEADMVIGSRFLGASEFSSTFLRRIGIGFFSIFFYLLSGKWITDPTSGYRAMNTKVISLFAHYYPADYPEPEALVMLHNHNLKISEMAVSMKPRLGGVSSISLKRSIYYMIKVPFAMFVELARRMPWVSAS